MKSWTLWNYIAAAAVAAVLCGCQVGPDYERPTTLADDAAYHNTEALDEMAADANSVYDAECWWERFDDATLNTLVERALASNKSIEAAAAQVLAAQARFRQAYGARLPELAYSGSAGRSRMGTTLPNGERDHSYIHSYELGLNVSFSADLFGRLKRMERSAWANYLASDYAKEAVIDSVAAAVVSARIEIATQQRLLKVAQGNTENWDEYVAILERRYSQGIEEAVNVRIARESLAASKASESAVTQQLKLGRLALDELLYLRPGADANELPMTLADLPELLDVPMGLPAELLDHRPDVKQAEMTLAAQTEAIGASIAALYPDLTLTASGGYASNKLRELIDAESLVYNAVAGLAGPIFRGGKLREQVKEAEATAAAAAANYAGTVVTAMKEVEEALVREHYLRERLAYQQRRYEEAVAAEALARQRYQSGIAEILLVLETERSRRLAENEIVTLKGLIWQARAALYLALGA